MDFSLALQLLRTGQAMQRESWNGVRAGRLMFVKLLRPGDGSKMTEPYLFLTTISGASIDGPHTTRIPWLASQADLLATDWDKVEEP